MASHATGDGGIPKRGVEKDGLKRIMTLGGAYGTRNYTVKDLRDCKGQKILIMDDLLATGGTLAATARLVEMAGGIVSGIGVIIELSFLDGRKNLSEYHVHSLIRY